MPYTVLSLSVSLCILLFVLPPCVVAEEESNLGGNIEERTDETNPEKEYTKQWFIYGGATNYHTRLEPSERQIDKQINGTFGRLLPRWHEPETFKDWSDDWKLWDLWVGVGRDISPQWTWSVSVGGGEGTIKNDDTYRPLLIPAKVKIEFTRLEAYVEGCVSWFPWGKPYLTKQSEEKKSGLLRALNGSRPFLDLAAGYDYQVSEADVRVKMPLLGTVFRQQQKDDYHLLFVNPRIGIETPISEKNSIGMMAGYAFFHEHGDEFNSSMINVFFRHRF